MDFIGLPTNTRTSEQWLLAEPAQRGTWLALYFYCAEAENGGVIFNCQRWSDRIWGNACAVTKTEIDSQCDLWWWEDDSLHVWGYDTIGEAKVIRNRGINPREAGRLGGSKTSPAKAQAARLNGAKNTPPKQAQADPSGTQATTQAHPSEGKRREEKGGEEEAEDIETKTTTRVQEASPSGANEDPIEWVETAEAVRFLCPLFDISPDLTVNALTMEAAHRVFASGVLRSDLVLIEAFYSAAPSFLNRSSWHQVHEDDPRRFRRMKLDTLIDDFAAQCGHAQRWQNGSWRTSTTPSPATGEASGAGEKEKGRQSDPEGWLAAWTAVCGDDVPPRRLGDAEPELQLRVRRWLFERSQAQKSSEPSVTHA
jgi:hypothetical protein